MAIGMAACGDDKDDDIDSGPDGIDFEIEDIGCSFDYVFTYNGRRTGSWFNAGWIDKKITITRQGDTYYVEAKSNDIYNEWIYFTFTKKGNKFGPIQNLKAGRTPNTGSSFSFEASNVAFKNVDDYGAYWVGKDDNGMTISNLMESDEYGAGNGYIADPHNELQVDITFK